MSDKELMSAFKLGLLDPKTFRHEHHVKLAFYLLKELPFLEACVAMRDGLKKITVKAGKPERYHETMTIAFMAVVLDRLQQDGHLDWAGFCGGNRDLSDRSLLSRYYAESTLDSAKARAQFVLEERRSPLQVHPQTP
jgi:hypothetical protein